MSTNHTSQKIVLSTLALFIFACGAAKSKKDEADTTTTTTTATATTVGEQTPSDSTGGKGTVAMALNRPASGTSLWGDDVTADGLQLADLAVDSSITLKTAQLSVASIRIKANKEQSDDEKSLEGDEDKEAEAQKKLDEAKREEMKTIKEQEKELAKMTDATEKAKKQSEYDGKKGEQRKKQAEAMREADKKLAEKEGGDKNLRWKGPYVYDMIAGSVTPALADVQIPDGSYRRVEFKLKPYRDGASTDPLMNNSIYVSGTAVVAGVSKTFEFLLQDSEKFRLSGDKFKVDASATNKIAINLDPTAWFTGVDFSLATANADGTLTLDAESNKSLWKIVRRNIKKSVICGKDARGDGRIKTAESAADSSEFSKAEEAAGK